MPRLPRTSRPSLPVSIERRRILRAAGGGAVVTLLGVAGTGISQAVAAATTLRWGIVGTGSIANRMASRIQQAESSELVAVSSRKMETATSFANKHSISRTFDSWSEMADWSGVDALFIATPSSVKEEIGVAAASHNKHVLVDKPFANLPSLQRITSACRKHDVAFMDGTHFVHHPRTANIRARMREVVGQPWSLHSSFQFNLKDRSNIRYNPDLEPYGAIGDAGWYCMRAAVEYLSDEATLASASSYLRRDAQTGAAISGSGVIQLDDGSTSNWSCGFDSGAPLAELRISGTGGMIRVDDFIRNRADGSAHYRFRKVGAARNSDPVEVQVESGKPADVILFENFAVSVLDKKIREQNMRTSERTQHWLDAAWESAVQNETRSVLEGKS